MTRMLGCAAALGWAALAFELGGLLASAGAADLLPPDRPIAEAIDHYIDARLADDGVSAAPHADDANLIRRLTLDLVGRIPTLAEVQEYVDSRDPNKRAHLVDRLMASPGFLRNQVIEFDNFLMYGSNRDLKDYLAVALAENRPWDQIFRELLIADGADPKTPGADAYLKSRIADVDKLTNEVSVQFFGVNVSCAMCHNHPLVSDWKQDHFFGMKSFFSRTFDNGDFLGERDYGLVEFKTTDGEARTAKLMFLTGAILDEPESVEPSDAEKNKEKQLLEKLKKDKAAPPPPKYSRRARLSETALAPGNNAFFSRAIVNRLWNRFYGRGLVMPLDQMHSENEPSHPELLAWLARDFQDHQYDLLRLTRGLVMSQAYSRSSRWESGSRPTADLFAVAAVRPLTPMQLGASLRLAVADPVQFEPPLEPSDVEKRIETLEKSGQAMASLFEMPHEDFQVSVDEALLFTNGERVVKELLGEGGDRLLTRLLAADDRSQAIDTVFRVILSRPPADDETKLISSYLGQREDRSLAAWQQVMWSLLTSAEFRFNY